VTPAFGEAAGTRPPSVHVLDTAGREGAAGPAESVAGQPTPLRVPVRQLPDGVFTVNWRTVSAVDGHVAAGSFAFGVGVAPTAVTTPGGTVTQNGPSASLAATIARWILYAGLIAMVGAAYVGIVCYERPPRPVVGLAVVGWAAAAAGTAAVIAIQWADAGASIGTIVGSSIGVAGAERIAVALLAAFAVLLLVRRPSEGRRIALGAVGGFAATGMLVDVVNGHAAAGATPLIQVAVQWLHVLAVGAWVGGLGALLLTLRGSTSEDRARAARRFSRWAGFALAAVAVTGVIRAIVEIGTWDALFGTDFGRLVIAKAALLVVLAALGTANHFITVPAAARNLTGLRRVGSVEVSVASVVLVLTAVLVNVAPPASAASGPPPVPASPLIASGSDFGTTVKVRLAVEPGTAGFNRFTAVVTDFDTGAPVVGDGVTLRFTLASTSGLGPSMLDLAPSGASGSGTFAASGGNISQDGIWQVDAVVTPRGGPAVEVPLVLPSRVAPQTVDVVASPGAPTISTVHLDAGRTVQVYLDPGSAGQNDLHATFFDATGAEVPVQTATIATTTAAGIGAVLNPRQLEPGHFVANATLTAGMLGVDVVGPAPDGGRLHAHLEVTVNP